MNDRKLIENLIQNLSNGETEFTYRKQDGSLRTAKGTTKLELIPEDVRPAGGIVAKDGDKSIAYYDLNSKGFRMFSVDRVVSA